MANASNAEDLAVWLQDKIVLRESLSSLRQKYNTLPPFPHLVLDDFFAKDIIQGVCTEIPSLSGSDWVHHKDDHQDKFGSRSAASMGEYGTQLTSLLHSAAFLFFLSEVTGIKGLLPDPYLQGGGYHVLPRGGKFDVHIDRKTDYIFGLRRRLALIVYLNAGWQPEYGGQLELWDKQGKGCVVSVEPNLNTAILFEVADGNYHGNPTPIACPPGQTRNSFIVYYHTIPEDGQARTDLLSSVFAPSFVKKKFRMRTLVKDLTPPMVFRMLNRARAKQSDHQV